MTTTRHYHSTMLIWMWLASTVPFLGSCREEPAALAGPGVGPLRSAPTSSVSAVYPAERPFQDLANDLPTSAGFFIDTATGNVIVSFVDQAEGNRAVPQLRSRLGWAIASARARKPQADIVIRPVEFSFIQLSEWRDKMNESLGLPGVVWLDLDEVQNRIVIGILKEADVGRIRGLAETLHVPANALQFEEDGPFRYQTALNDSVRPITGATQIQRHHADTTYTCSLGFPSIWNGQRGFVTASHCSVQIFSTESTQQYQPRVPLTHTDSMNIQSIGFEVADSSTPCPPHVHASACSLADAAVYQLAIDSSQWVLGRIARPTFGCLPGPCSPLNLQIGSYFIANAADASIIVGDLVSHIGVGTGWSQAFVQKTCFNVTYPQGVIGLCQDGANYGQGNGDSGGPVLLNIGGPSDSTVTIGGVHTGATNKYSVFSPWAQIAQEYPGLVVH